MGTFGQYTGRARKAFTPAFWAWFGDSVMRDADGTPTVFYHGTGAKVRFTAFMDWRPAFFTPDKEYTKTYVYKGGGRARVIPVYLRIERPFDPSRDEEARRFYNEQFIPFWREKYPRQSEDKNFAPLEKGETLYYFYADQFWSFLRRWTREHGPSYDGLIVDEGEGWSKHPAYVPLYPWQIKAARGNRGTFDPADPDILHGLSRRR